ncbi:MAG TPA: SCP2 sterol-binding domain-containing protein [Candidatus Macondimonas sp.]|nr:SCP2 sterol-binding domain-containing protein [Candidatus Macondimonas sp.]
MRGNDALPLALLEQALNHNLRDSPAASRLLGRLQGRILALHLRELGRTLHLRAHPAGIQVLMATEQPADAQLSGTLAGLTRLAAGAATGGLPPGVSLNGAVEVAEGFQQLLTLARPDFEALLSRAVGDALAHTIGTGLRRVGGWMRRSLTSLGLDTSEYLRYEAEMLPDRAEVDAFVDEVDRLRDDVARLAARVARLQQSSRNVHAQPD